MISSKNHITRQKNVECIGSNEDSTSNNNIHSNLSENFSLTSNNSNANSNEELTNKQGSQEPTNNLGDNKVAQEFLTVSSSNNISCNNSNLLTNPIIKTGKSSSSSRHQLSTALRERILRSKSPRPSHNHKLLATTLSNPVVPANKLSRSANLEDVSGGGSGSFFSRSCPGDELTGENDTLNDKISKINMNMKTNSLREEMPSQSLKSIGKSILAFATLKHTRHKKYADSNGSLQTNNSNSNWSSLNNEADEAIGSQASSLSSTSNESTRKTHTKIGLYDVDLEKIARELSKPSVDTPLTSFTLSPNPKPVLQSSKTVDEDSSLSNNKKPLLRSLTQNK